MSDKIIDAKTRKFIAEYSQKVKEAERKEICEILTLSKPSQPTGILNSACVHPVKHPAPRFQDLFDHMLNEHGVMLLETEMLEIIKICKNYENPDS